MAPPRAGSATVRSRSCASPRAGDARRGARVPGRARRRPPRRPEADDASRRGRRRARAARAWQNAPSSARSTLRASPPSPAMPRRSRSASRTRKTATASRGGGCFRPAIRLGTWRRAGRLVARIPAMIKRAGASALMLHHAVVTAAAVERAHAAGAAVWAWTVDDPAELARLEAAGVDAVISNDPGIFGSRGYTGRMRRRGLGSPCSSHAPPPECSPRYCSPRPRPRPPRRSRDDDRRRRRPRRRPRPRRPRRRRPRPRRPSRARRRSPRG